MAKKAFFLDRDGVVIRQISYLHDPELVELEKNVPQAIRKIHEKGMLAVVLTNQSGVARGMFTEKDVDLCHQRLQELLAQHGEKIDAFYTCCHHPDFSGECSCRKPKPGLFVAAAQELDIDTASSFMVGDKFSDLESGRNAGVKQSILLETGYGLKYIQKALDAGFDVCADLLETVEKYT